MTLDNMGELIYLSASPGNRPSTQRSEESMADEKFGENLNRVIAAELHFLNRMTASREMFGKSYFSLGIAERAAVDQTVLTSISGIYQGITPASLEAHVEQPIGFGVHPRPTS
jgi:hypothetical protein